MIKVLLDINVILDVLQARKPDYEGSAQVLSLCVEGIIQGYLSAISFGTIYYILTKERGRAKGLSAIKKVCAITHVAMVDETAIHLALDSDFADLEDAIQHYSAVGNGLTHIITRNKKDFSKAQLIVATPEEFLAMIQ